MNSAVPRAIIFLAVGFLFVSHAWAQPEATPPSDQELEGTYRSAIHTRGYTSCKPCQNILLMISVKFKPYKEALREHGAVRRQFIEVNTSLAACKRMDCPDKGQLLDRQNHLRDRLLKSHRRLDRMEAEIRDLENKLESCEAEQCPPPDESRRMSFTGTGFLGARNDAELESFVRPIRDVLGALGNTPPRVCAPCQPLVDTYHVMKQKLLPLVEEQRPLEKSVREQAQGAPQDKPFTEDEYRLLTLNAQLSELRSDLEALEKKIVECLLACGQLTRRPVGTLTPDNVIVNWRDEYDGVWRYTLYTDCPCAKEECRALASALNAWVSEQWERFFKAMGENWEEQATLRDYEQLTYQEAYDEHRKAAAAYLTRFLEEYRARRAELDACCGVEEVDAAPPPAEPVSSQVETCPEDQPATMSSANEGVALTGGAGEATVEGAVECEPAEDSAVDKETSVDEETSAYEADLTDQACAAALQPHVPLQPENLDTVRADAGVSQACAESRLGELLASPTSTGAQKGESRFIARPELEAANDPYLAKTGSVRGGVADAWGLSRIGLYDGRIEGIPSETQPRETLVAVIDSGLDIAHPELANKIWTNSGEKPGNGVDDDGNGYIDDIHGWNFVAGNENVGDDNGHGTLVAGIVGAQPNNGKGVAGVNPWATLLPVKVADFIGHGNSVDLAEAIRYSIAAGARVINISMGGRGFSSDEEAAVTAAHEAGALVVVAAGNLNIDTREFWPAGLDGVITVAAIDHEDQRAAYSNWGGAVDIAAPGSHILSLRARYTDPVLLADPDYRLGNNIVGGDRQYYHVSGTSFAAPYVAGVASMLFSVYPDIGPDEVKRMLLNAADDIAIPGIDIMTGYGVLNARRALQADRDFYITARIEGVALVDGNAALQVMGSADADDLDSARLQIGKGAKPGDWVTVADDIRPAAVPGELGKIPSAMFQGAKLWTIRVLVRHANGREAEYRYELKLG